MIPPEEAWRRIEEHLAAPTPQRLPRRDALGRRLCRPVIATTEVPANDVSALDGYAFAGELPLGTTLPVTGTIAAGDPPGASVAPGSALKIWTGAPFPAGADRVVAVEDTESLRDGSVRLLRVPAAGNARRRAGEVVRSGDLLLAAGDPLGPAALALLASQGLAEVTVAAPPRVAILPTGDEVVSADRVPAPGQLRDSHSDFLLGALRELALAPTALPIARDDEDELTRRVASALEEHDVVLVCGGVSRGERDFTEIAFERVGARCEVEAVAIQPGKPFVFAHRGGRLLFGLPGNPASVMVAFRLFVDPALRRLEGDAAAEFWSDARAVELTTALPAGRQRDRFVPARRIDRRGGRERVAMLDVRGSHDLATFARADRLLRIRAGEPARAPGELVEAIVWR
jgi:molybdenum cofactor synthesis domain-containing protein